MPDTHAVLWLLAADNRLSESAYRLLADSNNEVLLSAAVVWEVALKQSIGKLTTPPGFVDRLLESGATPLPISVEHAQKVGDFAWHHRDPFDRILIAQAVVEQAAVVSADARLGLYGIPVEW